MSQVIVRFKTDSPAEYDAKVLQLCIGKYGFKQTVFWKDIEYDLKNRAMTRSIETEDSFDVLERKIIELLWKVPAVAQKWEIEFETVTEAFILTNRLEETIQLQDCSGCGC